VEIWKNAAGRQRSPCCTFAMEKREANNPIKPHAKEPVVVDAKVDQARLAEAADLTSRSVMMDKSLRLPGRHEPEYCLSTSGVSS